MVETVFMAWGAVALPVILGGLLGMLIGIFCDR